MPRVHAVLIDLDGTLMDTVPDLARAANRMRADFGLAPLTTERIAAFVGKGADVLIRRALADDLHGEVEAGDHAAGRESFFRHYHAVNGLEAVVFPQVEDALALLGETGLKLACVTNKPREFTVPLLERAGLAPHFAAVVAGDDVSEKKPHPALLLAACERLGCAPAASLMIGDSVNDALAARAAGMPVILVETGYNEGEPVATLAGQAGVDAIVASFIEAARWVVAARS